MQFVFLEFAKLSHTNKMNFLSIAAQMFRESAELLKYLNMPCLGHLGTYLLHKMTNGDVKMTKQLILQGKYFFVDFSRIKSVAHFIKILSYYCSFKKRDDIFLASS